MMNALPGSGKSRSESSTLRRALALAASFAALSAAYAEGEDPYANYVKLLADDNNSHFSYSTAGFWSDGRAPHPDTNYYVAADRIMLTAGIAKTTAADYTNCWHGGQLVIAGKLRPAIGAGHQYSPCIPDLVLLGGSEIQYTTYGFFATHEGKSTVVTVQSTFDNPATISQHYYDSVLSGGGYRGCVSSSAAFVGSQAAHLVLTRPFVNYSGQNIDHGFYFQLDNSSFTDYHGTLTLLGSNTIVTAVANGAMNAPDCALRLVDAPEVGLGANSDAAAAAAARLRSLSAPAGLLNFYYRATGTKIVPRLDVTESLAFGPELRTKINYYDRAGITGMPEDGTHGTLARMAALGPDATVDLADGLVPEISGSAPLPPYYQPYLKVVEEAGSRYVDAVVDKLVVMHTGNIETTGAAGTQFGAFQPGYGHAFSNNEDPTSDKDYHYYAREKLCCFQSIEMPKATLTYAGGCSWKGGRTIHFKEIGMYTGISMGMWSSSTIREVVAEKFHVIPNGSSGSAAAYWFNGSHDLRIMADLHGPGNAIFRIYTPAAEGFANLCNDNSNFHGRLVFAQAPKTGNTCDHYKLKIYLSDGLNWGGEYTGTSPYNAIYLDNYPQINVTNNATLAQLNRGLLIRGGAKLNISANRTLRLANQVTYAGETTKTGAGTLDLAGTARFIDGNEATAPRAGTNVLAIAEGALRVSSKAAADGLAISFAAGTKLVIPSDSEAGLCDVKWDAPITVEGDALPVEIDFSAEDAARDSLSVPICTVNATAGADLPADLFSVAKPSNHLICTGVTKATVDGRVVFTANFVRKGFTVLVR